MPWNKVETDDGWCVVNQETGDPIQCYEGDEAEDKADRLIAAYRANIDEEDKRGNMDDEEEHNKQEESPEPDQTSLNPDDNLTEVSPKQFDESDWDGAASNWETAEAYCRDSLIDVNPEGEDKIKDLCFLPFRKDGSDEPNRNALQAIGGGRGITQVERPDDVPEARWNEALTDAAKRLIGWWPEAFEREAPESVFEIAGESRPAEKAGSRLRRTMVEKLQQLRDFANEMLGWALYEEDGQPPLKQEMFQGDVGAMTIKAADGRPWHIVWASNGFKDREGDIVSTKGLEDFVIANESRDDKGFFNFWHIKGTDFARKEWQGVIGRFLVEAGPYLNNDIGQAFQEFFKQYPESHPEIAPEGWGASIEFMFLPEEQAIGIYKTVHIDRTSTLPRFAAANIWTRSTQEFKVNDKQREALETILGKDKAEAIVSLSEKRTEELEQAGVEHKQADTSVEAESPVEAETKETTTTEETDFTLEEVVKAVVGHVAQPLAEGLNVVAEEIKAINKRLTEVEQAHKLQKEIEVPRFRLNLEDLRASKSPQTSVAENDDLTNKEPVARTDGSMASVFFPQK